MSEIQQEEIQKVVKASRISRFLRIINIAALVTVVCGLAFIVFTIIREESTDPVQYVSLSVEQKEYTSGDTLTYRFSTCRTQGKEYTGEISRSLVKVTLVDGKYVPERGVAPTILFNSSGVANDKGCRIANTTVIVPIVQTGTYQLRINGSYSKLKFLPPTTDEIYSDNVFNITRSERTANSDAESDSVAVGSQNTNVSSPSSQPQRFSQPQPQTGTTTITTNNSTTNNNTTVEPQPTPVRDLVNTITNPVNNILKTVTE